MKLLELALAAGKLKKVKRTGWVLNQIQEPESVADHSHRAATLAVAIASERGLKVDRVAQLALLHDLAEGDIGDIPTDRPGEFPTKVEKDEMEWKSIEDIATRTDMPELTEIFKEFTDGTTLESQLVRQVDKLEMAIQALEYELETGKVMNEFYSSAQKAIVDPQLTAILNQVLKRRPKH